MRTSLREAISASSSAGRGGAALAQVFDERRSELGLARRAGGPARAGRLCDGSPPLRQAAPAQGDQDDSPELRGRVLRVPRQDEGKSNSPEVPG